VPEQGKGEGWTQCGRSRGRGAAGLALTLRAAGAAEGEEARRRARDSSLPPRPGWRWAGAGEATCGDASEERGGEGVPGAGAERWRGRRGVKAEGGACGTASPGVLRRPGGLGMGC
jgi:hypothetical protein